MRPFRNRRDAGRQLAARLGHLRGADAIVLGLPRGGVPVAAEVARALDAPLDVIVVRKLGVPYQPELGMGAVGEGGVVIINDDVVRLTGMPATEIERVEALERQEVARRAARFRGDRAAVPLTGRTVVVVDDGIATGGTARVALQVARARGAARIVLAVPVAAADSLRELAAHADEVVCLETPPVFFAVGEWYDDFAQVPDDVVVSILAETPVRAFTASAGGQDDPPSRAHDGVEISAGSATLAGSLSVPARPIGIVAFAHGSGSSRHSPRNRFVAARLNETRLATLLFDLLTTAEEVDRTNVFDVPLLASRLCAATHWLKTQPVVAELPVGYFGASTGAAAAFWAAADRETHVRAVVSRGGRPDLAGPRLADVRAPTLLIVGGHDYAVLELNREAARRLHCEHRVDIVPGATHLFEEPGALDAVADRAGEWFTHHLGHARRAA